MAESTRLLLRQFKRLVFWPVEAVLALSMFGATRLLPPAASSSACTGTAISAAAVGVGAR